MKSLNPNLFSIFLWHRHADTDFAKQLAGDLRSRGFEVGYMGEREEVDHPSFSASDWQMARSDCIILLLSEAAIKSDALQTDAEKVMRRKDARLIPVYLDDRIAQDLPLLLQFIHPIEFYRDYSDALENLLEVVYRIIRGEPDSLRKTNKIWVKPFRWSIEHFRRYLVLSPLTFSWQITVENLIVSLAVTGFIYLIWQPSPRTNLESITASTYLWTIIILGPIVETLLLQAIPILVARILGLRLMGQLLFSIIPFAILHFTRSVGAGIGAGIIGGFYSAFTYVHWQSKSTWTAIWVTAFSHCLYNLALFAMLIGEF